MDLYTTKYRHVGVLRTFARIATCNSSNTDCLLENPWSKQRLDYSSKRSTDLKGFGVFQVNFPSCAGYRSCSEDRISPALVCLYRR